LAKALVARTAVQAITAITGAILDAADAASEFELSIARISNIAQGPGSSIAELEQSLSQLAVTLGRPQAEVAEAAFEALQNDLGSTTDTMQLLEGAANDLALVTGGTLTQAVNSLSSVLKAYDLPASKAGEITDLFFAAIDKGRISLKELESSLGKITPLAAQLDVDFANVAAAMAAITQSGTTAATANTQLRSIFQKLIRPTEQLQGAFNKLGVETFNQLIDRSDNLQDALQKIAGALDNDSQKIAEAFGRLRGQLGVFNLLANEGKIFQDTMEAVADSAGKAAEGAARITPLSVMVTGPSKLSRRSQHQSRPPRLP
ncbi:MAG: phage tail tape measure protein, partial [Planctomycetota bacterium]